MARILLAIIMGPPLFGLLACAGEFDELTVKRNGPFEFASVPVVTRDGDRITVGFEAKAACDATIAVEDGGGKIVRHLASGVLGDNAPVPFQKGTLKQVVIWDGKDDAGRYVDDKDNCVVRVSLGLDPRFERTLHWSPKRVYGERPPLLAASEKGVYVFDGGGADHLRLFDYEGDYVKTVYPFPAAKLPEVKGLSWFETPQGPRIPLKTGFYQNTLLPGGENSSNHHGADGSLRATNALAAHNGRIALGTYRLLRLAADGTSGGLPMVGPEIALETGAKDDYYPRLGPSHMAFAPDGRTLYLTGYLCHKNENAPGQRGYRIACMHGVLKMDYEKDEAPKPFAGKATENGHGSDDTHFAVPTSVACDAQGRVYVSDFLNNRVQIFDPAGKLLKSLPVEHPARVLVHPKSGEIYVFEWATVGIPYELQTKYDYKPYWNWRNQKAHLVHLGTFDRPGVQSKTALPFSILYCGYGADLGQMNQAVLDPSAAEPTFWLVTCGGGSVPTPAKWANDKPFQADKDGNEHVWIFSLRDGKIAVKRSFAADALRQIPRVRKLAHNIQHLSVNPSTGKLYLGEADSGPTGKAFNDLVEIDPASGRCKLVRLPFNPMDVTFDINGLAYLRTTNLVARYDARTWREVPWDYGTELEAIGDEGGAGGHQAPVLGALELPSSNTVCYHQSGMGISPKGHLVVACGNRSSIPKNEEGRLGKQQLQVRTAYTARVYPGRLVSPTSCCLHIFDKHGQKVCDDAVPGAPQLDGVQIDKDDNLYLLATPARMVKGKPYFDRFSSTLIKFRPKQGKFVSKDQRLPVPVTADQQPQRAPDLFAGGTEWVENAEWFHGGVGYAGFDAGFAPSCACWHVRFRMDYFARSFAPAPYRYCVDVVDANGNKILAIGRAGNVDDGKPMIAEGGPPHPVSIGGDEVALFHPCFIGLQSDKRLFVSDFGNARIVSVSLGYHAQQRVSLKDVPDTDAQSKP